jgi:hypothetical protein
MNKYMVFFSEPRRCLLEQNQLCFQAVCILVVGSSRNSRLWQPELEILVVGHQDVVLGQNEMGGVHMNFATGVLVGLYRYESWLVQHYEAFVLYEPYDIILFGSYHTTIHSVRAHNRSNSQVNYIYSTIRTMMQHYLRTVGIMVGPEFRSRFWFFRGALVPDRNVLEW